MELISLFSGISILGYKLAGFKDILSIESNQDIIDSLKANFPKLSIQEVASSKNSFKFFTNKLFFKQKMPSLSFNRGELEVLDSAPFQKKVHHNSFKEYILEVIRLVDELQPKVFVIKNYPSDVNGSRIGIFNNANKSLKSLNYKVKTFYLNPKYYGVALSCEYVVTLGVRNDLEIEPSFPKGIKKYCTLKDILPDVQGFFNNSSDIIQYPNKYISSISNLTLIKNNKETEPTIDELKKICSFPDNFVLSKRNLLNTIPPRLIYHIAKHIKGILLNANNLLPSKKLPAIKGYYYLKKPTTIKKVERKNWTPMLTSQFPICPVPFRFDTYKGCLYNCRYCFARIFYINHNIKNPIYRSFSYLRGIKPDTFDNWILKILSKKEYDYTKGNEVAFKERIPLKIGTTSDPFPPVESKYRITYETLKILHRYDYPIVIQTKNPSGLAEIAKEFKNPNWSVAVSLISVDQDFLNVCEPNAPTANERLHAIKQITSLGIPVMVKIQPAIYPKIVEDLPALTKAIKESGCWAFNIEGLKIRCTSYESEKKLFKPISDYLHFDLLSYYKKETSSCISDWELSKEKKLTYINYAQIYADKYNLKFFVADNHLGCIGCSSECCGTEVLRSYKIYGNNFRTRAFPKKNNYSKHIGKVLINYLQNSRKKPLLSFDEKIFEIEKSISERNY